MQAHPYSGMGGLHAPKRSGAISRARRMSDQHTPDATHLPFLLAIVGDSGSGKSTVASGVAALIGPERVSTLELDDYHRYTRAERQELGVTALNPSVHNFPLMQEHLQLLGRGRRVRNRAYDHSDGTFGAMRTIEPAEVVLVRGLLGFPNDELRAAYDLAVFLQPEPELLFRWKLRRDVKTRGYTEAEVLKRIARHLLDSKEYVLPQAERADLVVRYEIPEWDSPDSEVRATLTLRRAAAEAVRCNGIAHRFGEHVSFDESDDALVLGVGAGLPAELVDAWAAERFPDTFAPGTLGRFMDDEGNDSRLEPLAFAQVLIADLTLKLRRTVGVTHEVAGAVT
jgi:phosphoribulokinase